MICKIVYYNIIRMKCYGQIYYKTEKLMDHLSPIMRPANLIEKVSMLMENVKVHGLFIKKTEKQTK